MYTSGPAKSFVSRGRLEKQRLGGYGDAVLDEGDSWAIHEYRLHSPTYRPLVRWLVGSLIDCVSNCLCWLPNRTVEISERHSHLKLRYETASSSGAREGEGCYILSPGHTHHLLHQGGSKSQLRIVRAKLLHYISISEMTHRVLACRVRLDDYVYSR